MASCAMTSSALSPRWIGSVAQSLPSFALFDPIGFDRDLVEFIFTESECPIGCGPKIEQFLLVIRGEVAEVEDLRDSGSGDAGGAGDLGLVFDLAGGEQVFQTNGEGHQFGDVGHSWFGLASGRFG